MCLNIPCIYGIYNRSSGKWYVGQTANFRNRMSCHLSGLRKRAHRNSYLQRSFDVHGESSFEFVILEEVPDRAERNVSEVVWIDFFRSHERAFGYNLESGGGLGKEISIETRQAISARMSGPRHPWYGKHLPPETKLKISIANTGNKKSPEEKEHLRIIHTGMRASPEARRKMSLGQIGRRATPETREKISRAHAGKPKTEAQRVGMKSGWAKWKANNPGVVRRPGGPRSEEEKRHMREGRARCAAERARTDTHRNTQTERDNNAPLVGDQIPCQTK